MLIDRLLQTIEGDAGAAGTGAGDASSGSGATAAGDKGAAAGGGNGTQPSWYASAETLKTSDPEIWTSFEKSIQSGGHKDLAGLVKHSIGLEKKLGSAINLPDKAAKPEDVDKWGKDLGEKIKGHGLAVIKAQDAPPDSPDKYEVKFAGIPEPFQSKEMIDEFRKIAHEEGLTQRAVGKLAALHEKLFTSVAVPILAADRQKAQQEFDAWAESIGKESKALQAHAGAWLTKNFTEQQIQALEAIKIPTAEGGFITAADHPVLLRMIAQAGLDTGEDISEVHGTGDPTADAEFNEVLRMTTDATHPDYKLWTKGDASDPQREKLQARYDAAFKKRYGTGEYKAEGQT